MAKLKVLVVEDEAISAFILDKRLTQAGYEVCGLVATGEAAVESARQDTPAVVLMDIQLAGEIDGIEAARQISAFASPILIFISGYSDETIKARALMLHPAAYLYKPIEIKHVEAAIQAATH